jgi:hypothetical protein
LFGLKRYPQVKNLSIRDFRSPHWKMSRPASFPIRAIYDPIRPFRIFVLTWGPWGNSIQLQSFGGCDSVETDSPINITLVEQGDKCSPLGVSILFRASVRLPGIAGGRALGYTGVLRSSASRSKAEAQFRKLN